MPVLTYDDKPWRTRYKRLTPDRVLLIANTARSWSVELTKYYARLKGIPEDNILYLNTGTSTHYVPTDVMTEFVAPVATATTQLGAQAVLLGPGVQSTVQLAGITGESPNYVVDPETNYWPGLGQLAGYAKKIQTLGSINSINQTSNRYELAHYTNGTTISIVGGDWPDGKLGVSNTGNVIYDWYDVPNPPVSHNELLIVTEYATKLLGTSSNVAIPHGKIGMGSYTTYNMPETEALSRAIIDRAHYASQSIRQADAFRSPILIHANSLGGYTDFAGECVGFADLFINWGLNVKIYFRVNPSNKSLIPVANIPYEYADVQAGDIVNDPYFIQLGSAGQEDATTAPYSTAWKSLLGGLSFIGPSNGYKHALNNLNADGLGGGSNNYHIGGSSVHRAFALTYYLLAGLTLVEAQYYCGDVGLLVCGDPLWNLYSDDRRVIGGSSVSFSDVTKFNLR